MQTQFITIAATGDEPVDSQNIVDLAKTAVPDSYAISAWTIDSDIFDPDGKRAERKYHLPLNRSEIWELSDDDHRMSVIVSVHQEDYMRAFAAEPETVLDDTHFDLLHNQAFSVYGEVEEQVATIVAVDERSFIVRYSCRFMDL